MLACAEWLEERLLASVPHRPYVFALLWLIRPFFRQGSRDDSRRFRRRQAIVGGGAVVSLTTRVACNSVFSGTGVLSNFASK